ncbi:gluconate 2-dehydrogenase subunit 3 family protein [Frondihabitans cladoniiphilus]|uniref:Uncharacterized protein n=1 Tax=Frondihabitans cladoniiphilus TaxID=715785 RepID=A0ABP8W6A8_9MICO
MDTTAPARRPSLFVIPRATPGSPDPAGTGFGVGGSEAALNGVLDVVPTEGATADDVIRTIRRTGSTRWLLAGPAEVVVEVANRVLAGEPGVFGLTGVVVLGEDAPAGALRVTAPPLPRLSLAAPDDAAVLDFWRSWAGTSPELPSDFAKTIASSRTSSRTRGILARRALADDPDFAPSILTPSQLTTLRAVADRVVPQGDGPTIDLAARVDAQLAAGLGDGFRDPTLPSDQVAYGQALDLLAGFEDDEPEARDARLGSIVDGTALDGTDTRGGLGAGAPAWTSAQLSAWFDDARVDLVRQWLAHPATLNRIGWDAFANGGDGTNIQGFQLLLPNEREAWEPAMEVTR